jgi:hypothetical protein
MAKALSQAGAAARSASYGDGEAEITGNEGRTGSVLRGPEEITRVTLVPTSVIEDPAAGVD